MTFLTMQDPFMSGTPCPICTKPATGHGQVFSEAPPPKGMPDERKVIREIYTHADEEDCVRSYVYVNALMNELRERAGERCECESSECLHAGRCEERLMEGAGQVYWEPWPKEGKKWSDSPATRDFLAICRPCLVPRKRKAGLLKE